MAAAGPEVREVHHEDAGRHGRHAGSTRAPEAADRELRDRQTRADRDDDYRGERMAHGNLRQRDDPGRWCEPSKAQHDPYGHRSPMGFRGELSGHDSSRSIGFA